MNLDVRKPVIGISDKAKHKSICSALATSQNAENMLEPSWYILLGMQRITMTLMCLCGYAGWFSPLFYVSNTVRLYSSRGPIIYNKLTIILYFNINQYVVYTANTELYKIHKWILNCVPTRGFASSYRIQFETYMVATAWEILSLQITCMHYLNCVTILKWPTQLIVISACGDGDEVGMSFKRSSLLFETVIEWLL